MLKKGKSVDKINNLIQSVLIRYMFFSSNELLLSASKLYKEMSARDLTLQLGTLKNCLKI